MTKRFGIALASLLLSPWAFASDPAPLARCTYTVKDAWDGTVVSRDVGFVRLGHEDRLVPGSDLSLWLKIEEADLSLAVSGYRLEGKVFSPGRRTYFRPSETHASADFGASGRLIGDIHCENPKEYPFYFVAKDQDVVFLSNDEKRARKYDSTQELSFFLGQPELCIEGDLSAAHDLIESRWSLPIENMAMVDGTLEWDWVEKICVKYGELDERGRECLEWVVTPVGHTILPRCF